MRSPGLSPLVSAPANAPGKGRGRTGRSAPEPHSHWVLAKTRPPDHHQSGGGANALAREWRSGRSTNLNRHPVERITLYLTGLPRQQRPCPRDRCEDFLYILKAGPAGGRLRRPPSRRQRHDGHPGTGLNFQTEES
jgi:hypothetical protein